MGLNFICHFLNMVFIGAFPKRVSHHFIYPRGLKNMRSSSQELNRETRQGSRTNYETLGKSLTLPRQQVPKQYCKGVGLWVLPHSHPVTFSV